MYMYIYIIHDMYMYMCKYSETPLIWAVWDQEVPIPLKAAELSS